MLKGTDKAFVCLAGVHCIDTQPLDSGGNWSGIDSIPLVQRPRADQGVQPDRARGHARSQAPARPFAGVPCCAGALCCKRRLPRRPRHQVSLLLHYS